MKQPSKEQRERHAALMDFGNSVETPFTDLRSYPGESEQMREFLTITAIRRRMRMYQRAGLLGKPGTAEYRLFRKLEEELRERSIELRPAVRDERNARRSYDVGML